MMFLKKKIELSTGCCFSGHLHIQYVRGVLVRHLYCVHRIKYHLFRYLDVRVIRKIFR